MLKWIRKLLQMADFTGVNAKLDALKVAVDAVIVKVNTPPVEDPAIQAGIDSVAVTVQDQVDKLNSA